MLSLRSRKKEMEIEPSKGVVYEFISLMHKAEFLQ